MEVLLTPGRTKTLHANPYRISEMDIKLDLNKIRVMGAFGYDNYLPPRCAHCPIECRIYTCQVVSWRSHFVSAVTGFSGSLKATEARTHRTETEIRLITASVYGGWCRDG